MKKQFSLLLVLVLLFPLLPLHAGLAAEPMTVDYIYTFVPGTILEGEGTQVIQELLNAVSLRFTRQTGEGENSVRLQLESEGEIAVSLSASESEDGKLSITCSLLGGNLLVCQRDQLEGFLHTLVQVLADLKVLKGESLDRVQNLAGQAAALLEGYLSQEPEAPGAGIDLTPYLRVLSEVTSETLQRDPTEEEKASLGAVKVMIYRLNEAERRELVELALSKLSSIPALGDELKSGRLRIGEQVITDDFIREILVETPGEITLDVALDSEEKMVAMQLHLPDLSSIVADERFSKTRGVELTITRDDQGQDHLTSITDLKLIGLEGSLLTVLLERVPAEKPLEPLRGKHVHEVGEMNSEDLLKLIRSMGLTIVGNSMNMFLSLPKCVFDLAVDKLFRKK